LTVASYGAYLFSGCRERGERDSLFRCLFEEFRAEVDDADVAVWLLGGLLKQWKEKLGEEGWSHVVAAELDLVAIAG
jgi:hypothetical protein